MRPDMAKVIGERSRSSGWGWCAGNGHRKAWDRTPPEEWWSRERIKDRWGGGSNYPSDRRGPACRFLSANAGRPWDVVYSEVCAELRRGSLPRDRFLALLHRYVERSVILLDGVPCRGDGAQHGTPLKNYGGRYFYVCPESGLLLRAPEGIEPRP